jgi:beta-xylosidase
MIQTILYADDQVIISESEDELQIAVNELNKIVKKYDVKITTTKTKTVGLCGKNIQRLKIE